MAPLTSEVAGPGAPAQRAGRARSVVAFTVAVALGLSLGRFLTAGSGDREEVVGRVPPPGQGTAEAQVASLQDRLRVVPDDAAALGRLAVAYLGRARDTADPGYYAKASQAIERSLALDPAPGPTLTAAGLVALARHDFSAALEWGRRAAAAEPDAADPLGVVVDALVELGQYQEATAAAQAMVDRRPSLASLTRVSYLRELHGDQAGAVAAMVQALAAGSNAPGDVAHVQVLLGDLHLSMGEPSLARPAYEQAARTSPSYGPAEVGLARVTAAEGDVAGAARRLEPVVARLPDPGAVALLGDLYQALDRPADATAQFELVRRIGALNRASGVAVDLELARFEADHARDPGSRPPEVVALARAAQAQRPTVYGDDALGWALRQAGQPEAALPHSRAAVRLGTADAVLWYHLAAVEADLGMLPDARGHLEQALALNPHLTFRDRPSALGLAAQLGVPTP